MTAQKAIIIGSGVAGLAAAIRLAVEGMQVSVYERNASPGGKISHFEKEGFRFDAGPSLFTQPQNIEALFALAGEPIGEYFTYRPVDMSCKYFYGNGKVINAYADKTKFAAELETKAGEKKGALEKYLGRSAKLYNHIGAVFLDHSLHKTSTWLHPRIIRALRSVRLPYLFSSLAAYNKNNFTSDEAIQLFNRYATYNGSDPYQAPGMLSLIPHLEQNEGTFYPDGGMISIAHALYRLAVKKGVQFYFNTPVERIIHTEGKIHGVVAGNSNVPATVVVSNADVYFTFKELLGHQAKAKKLLKQERSSSALIFYWGINRAEPRLGLHNIFFTNDYRHEFDCIFKKGQLSRDPTIYINITSKMEHGHAPAGKENWFVMINAPGNTGQDWEKLKRQARQNIIEKLNRMLETDLEKMIETEESADPVLLEKNTGSFRGALYGSSSNSKMAAFVRPANFTSFVKGLYFCGGSVHPGGGIPLCLKSAKITAAIIKKDLGKSAPH
jgi:phytoene desaturase